MLQLMSHYNLIKINVHVYMYNNNNNKIENRDKLQYNRIGEHSSQPLLL